MKSNFEEKVDNILNEVSKAGDKGQIIVTASAMGHLGSMGDIEKLVKKLKKSDNLKIEVNYKDINTQVISGDIRDLNRFEMKLRQYMKKNSLPNVKIGRIEK